MLKKIIFDMDGLIFDSERIFMRELGIVMKPYGYEMKRENYVKTLGLTGDALLNRVREIYGEDYPHYEISRKARERVDKIAVTKGLPVKAGIRELLSFLKEQGVSCVVASSTHARYVEKYLDAAQLRGYFDAVIGGDMAERSKPEPDIFLMALGDTQPEAALVLEDSENGVIAASRAGIPVVCIPDMVQPRPEIAALTETIVGSAADIVKYYAKKIHN